MVDVDGVVVEDFRQSVLELVDAGQIGLGLGYKDIDTLGYLAVRSSGRPSPVHTNERPFQSRR